MTIKLYNTLSRAKEEFVPLKPGQAGMYTCGPTVYDHAHIGNLRTYVFEDVLRRVLEYNGLQVNHVMNITDVGHLTSDADEGEDKMEKGAKREGKSVWDIAAYYTEQFKKDLAALNIQEPSIWCKATDHIKEQIDQVKAIEQKGYAYTTSDGVYFDTTKLADYGKLARLNVESLEAGARIEMGDKRHKTDFALWKFSPTDAKRQMEWPSPWGTGFPGWHVECSAMSSKYLGEQFDVHTGGIDHISVHHTNEIAQAEVAFEKKPWVKYWLHGEFLVMDKGKMAKSGESFLTLTTLSEKGYDPLDYKYLCLTAHYRQQLKFSWEALDTAKQSRERLMNIIEELKTTSNSDASVLKGERHMKNEAGASRGVAPYGNAAHTDKHAGREQDASDANEKVSSYENEFLSSINDDLNAPQALATLWSALRDATLNENEKLALAKKFDDVLGLRLLDERTREEIPGDVAALADEREQARKAKDWKKSDELRAKINTAGYDILDGKDGYTLKKR